MNHDRSNFFLLANCRRIASMEFKKQPNWVLASELFAVGSTTAMKICRDANIDPLANTAVLDRQPDTTESGKS